MKLESWPDPKRKHHEPCISFPEMVELSGFSTATLRARLVHWGGPKPTLKHINSPGRVWYRKSEFLAWLESIKGRT